jgi:hypothetical protein
MAINMTAAGLYRLFSPAYLIRKDLQKTSRYTSVSSTIENQDSKEMVMAIFFELNKIKRILKEQGIKPQWTFKYIGKY